MKRLALLIAAALVQVAAAAPSKPNIILIFSDDLGWKDVGFNGSKFSETPNLDRLAKAGTTFPNAYASAGNCAPSRACLLSGTYTPRHGVFAVDSTDRGPKKSQRLIPIPNKSGLAKDNITLADALKSNGYATGIFGKWHLAGPEGAAPAEQGFDVVFDARGGANKKKADPEDPKGIFSITRETVKFIEHSKAEGRPFFAYVAHHGIHSPLESRPATLEKFRAKTAEPGSVSPAYAAATYDLDAGVGELLAKLRELGVEKDTLVIFTSDNGGTQQSSQEPLRGNKGGYYEGGIREPFIASWPGVIPEGKVTTTPIIQIDLFPTFLAAAGAKTPEGKQLDGKDLLPLLKGGKAPERPAIFWYFPGYLNNPVIRGREGDVKLGFRSRPVSVIRKGDWKLHLFEEEWQLDGGREKLATNGAVELYNLAADPGERSDLATKETAKRDELLNDLLAWRESVHAPVPTERNPAYDATVTAVKAPAKAGGAQDD